MDPTTHPSLASTFGWLFIAVVFASMLYGTSLIQLYNYCDNFWKTDKWPMKTLVCLVMAIDTIHQVLLVEPVYTYLVKDFGSFDKLQYNDPNLAAIALLTGFVVAPVQCLFIRRVWSLSNKNRIWTGCLIFLVAVEFSSIMVYYDQVRHAKLFSQLAAHAALTVERIMNALIAVTDLALAVSLAILLHLRRSGLARTDSILKRLIAYTVSTSLITAVVEILILVFAIVYPHSLLYIALDLVWAKLYINCMFVALNSRRALQNHFANPVVSDIVIHLTEEISVGSPSTVAQEPKAAPPPR